MKAVLSRPSPLRVPGAKLLVSAFLSLKDKTCELAPLESWQRSFGLCCAIRCSVLETKFATDQLNINAEQGRAQLFRTWHGSEEERISPPCADFAVSHLALPPPCDLQYSEGHPRRRPRQERGPWAILKNCQRGNLAVPTERQDCWTSRFCEVIEGGSL